jgi:hypothetical protein
MRRAELLQSAEQWLAVDRRNGGGERARTTGEVGGSLDPKTTSEVQDEVNTRNPFATQESAIFFTDTKLNKIILRQQI